MMDAGKKPATEIARELGIPRSRLYLWKEQLRKSGGEGAFPGRGKRVGQAAELDALKRENERLREENDILKKAARYFAKESS